MPADARVRGRDGDAPGRSRLGIGGAEPAGNNGTIKIDDTPFDDHPNNEPHVGCTLQVDFYGYDEGDLDATVTFEAHPPTSAPGTTRCC